MCDVRDAARVARMRPENPARAGRGCDSTGRTDHGWCELGRRWVRISRRVEAVYCRATRSLPMTRAKLLAFGLVTAFVGLTPATATAGPITIGAYTFTTIADTRGSSPFAS